MKNKLVYVLLSTALLVGSSGPIAAYGTEATESSALIQNVVGEADPSTNSSEAEKTESSVSEETTKESSEQTEESQPETVESSIAEEKEKPEAAPVEASADLLAATAIQKRIYTIRSVANAGSILSITDASKSNSALVELNSQMYQRRGQFEVIPVDGTWYVIKNVYSGLVLDIRGGSKANGAVVQQYQQNNSDAQKWQFVDAGNGAFYIQSKLGTVLDCPGGKTAAGTKLQTYALNHSKAQKWQLDTTIDPAVKDIAEGTYQITGSGTDKVLSLSRMLNDNSAKVSLYSSTYSRANEFKLTKTQDGWYYIANAYSNKVLDIAGGSLKNGVQLQQYSKNNSEAQQFRFIDAGNGYVYIQSKVGTVLDRAGAGTADGTKIQTYALNHSAAQKWLIEAPKAPKTVAVQNGVRYFVTSNVNANRIVEVSGGSTANGGNVQVWTENAVKQQKFIVESAGSGWYKLVNEKSGKVLDVAGASAANGANVQQYTWNNSDAQKFRFIDAGSGLTYIQSKVGSYLEVAGGQNKDGTNIQMYQLNRSKAQKFRLDALNKTNYIRTTILSSTTARVSVFNSSVAASSMKFPTWSETKGQDDVKWLDGSKSYDGSWTVVVNSKDFKDGGKYNTHVYANGNKGLGGTSYSLEKKQVQDDNAIRLSKPPYYYSQLDPRWSGLSYGIAKLGPSGCVPSSMAMVLRGSYGINVTPVDTANRLFSYGGFNQQYYGSSATDLFRGIRSYGRSISSIGSLGELNNYLSQGYPVIMFVDVGIGHAIVTHGYSNGYTNVYDPYGRQFYNGQVSTGHLWNTPSKESIDWTQGRPYFVVK